MKKTILIITLLLTFTATGFSRTNLTGYVGGGMGMPMAPDLLKETNKSGVNFFGAFGVQISRSFEIVGRVGYNMFPDDRDYLVTDLETDYPLSTNKSVDEGHAKFFEFGVDLKFNIPLSNYESAFQPYLVAGPGFTSITYDEIPWSLTTSSSMELSDVIAKPSVTKFGANFGAGFAYMFSSRIGAFVEGRYAMVFTDGDTSSYLPLRGGLTFNIGG